MKFSLILFLSTWSLFYLEGTSLSSGMQKYRGAIELCLVDDNFYQNFRREPILMHIYEDCGFLVSKEFGKVIANKYPYLLGFSNEFRKNEIVGNPQVFDFVELGVLAPLTVRFIHTLGEIQSMFDIEKECSIVEIGCGYGGLCSVISRVIDFGSYELIDLDFVLPLIDKYLEALEIQNFSTESFATCGKQHQYDLFISEYGISECYKMTQDEYIEKVLQHCKRGYIVYDNVNYHPKYNGKVYTAEEFCAKLREFGISAKLRSEVVRTGHPHPNKLIYWGEK